MNSSRSDADGTKRKRRSGGKRAAKEDGASKKNETDCETRRRSWKGSVEKPKRKTDDAGYRRHATFAVAVVGVKLVAEKAHSFRHFLLPRSMATHSMTMAGNFKDARTAMAWRKMCEAN